MADPAAQAHDGRRLRLREGSIVALIALALVAAWAGLGLDAFADPVWSFVAAVAVAVGVVCFLGAMELAQHIEGFRAIGSKKGGGAQYERARRWPRTKAASAVLLALIILGVGILFVALLARLHVLQLQLDARIALQGVDLFTGTMLTVAAVAFGRVLRGPIERIQTGLLALLRWLYTAIAVVVALLGAATAHGPLAVSPLRLSGSDAPFFLLGSVAATGAALFISRSLPTFGALFVAERDYYQARASSVRRTTVFVPTVVAFMLLFVVLFLVILFQLGYIGFVAEVPRTALLAGVAGLVLAAVAAATLTSYSIARSRDTLALYQERRSPEERRVLALLGASLTVAGLLLALGLWLRAGGGLGPIASDHWLDFVSFGLLAGLGPYGFYAAARARRTRRLEERFPDFLRDLAAGRKAGLTLEGAVSVAARGEYGELTPDIQKMAEQLSWNVPFDEALDRFAERVNTTLVRRAVTVIREAGRTGGHITDVLRAAAIDARELKGLENERRNTMSLYTIIVYITFFVFLCVIAILYASFIPHLLEAATASKTTTLQGGLSFSTFTKDNFRVFYFLAALGQGVGNGILAGILGSGRAVAGLRHAFAMVATTWIVFALVL